MKLDVGKEDAEEGLSHNAKIMQLEQEEFV